MRFAFSTLLWPSWDFETVAARAKEFGYDGVELHGFLNETSLTQSDPFMTDPKKVRAVFENAGVEIACLASSIPMASNVGKNRAAADNVRLHIDMAAGLGCGVVKIPDIEVRPGWNCERSAIEMGKWLGPIADYAMERGVTIAVENAHAFRRAGDMWLMLDVVGRRNIGAAWDPASARSAGERPAVSVPTLNSRIVYTQNTCAIPIGGATNTLKEFLIRLMGIGYQGYVALALEADGPKKSAESSARPEEMLRATLARWREITKPQAHPKHPKKGQAEIAAPAKL